MTTISKPAAGVPECIVKHGFKDEKYQAICVKRFWNAVAPHIAGDWKLTGKSYKVDNRAVDAYRHITVERADGLRLSIVARSSTYGRQDAVSIREGSHERPDGPYKGEVIETRYAYSSHHAATPAATVDPLKRSAKAFAGDIVRKVIEPVEKIGWPFVQKQLIEAREQAIEIGNGVAAAQELKLPLRPHWQNNRVFASKIETEKAFVDLEINHNGISVSSFKIAPVDLAAFVEFLRNLKGDVK